MRAFEEGWNCIACKENFDWNIDGYYRKVVNPMFAIATVYPVGLLCKHCSETLSDEECREHYLVDKAGR